MSTLLTTEVFAGSRWFAAAGLLLIVAGVWVLVRLVRSVLRGRRAERKRPAGSLVEAHPWLLPEPEKARGPRARVQPVVCPEPSDATQVLPRYDLDDATVVMYVVHPVDERERAR